MVDERNDQDPLVVTCWVKKQVAVYVYVYIHFKTYQNYMVFMDAYKYI